jgi:GntR family transcriptional regulator
MKNDHIDRDSYEPAYIQLASILRRQIAAGVYHAGDQLPSEAQLCAQFGVSPMTVRRVINLLAERGVVAAYQGKGTYVKALSLGEAAFRLEELNDHLAGQTDTMVRMLEARVVPAQERVALKLKIEPGTRVIFIRRLLLSQYTPILYHRDFLIYDPKRPVVEADLTITSLEGLFRGGSGENLRYGDLNIEPITLGEEESTLLELPIGTSAFSLEHTFYDFDSRPISWGWFVCRADRFKLSTRIGADADQ